MAEQMVINKIKRLARFPDTIKIGGAILEMSHYDMQGKIIQYTFIGDDNKEYTAECITGISRYGSDGKFNKDSIKSLTVEIY